MRKLFACFIVIVLSFSLLSTPVLASSAILEDLNEVTNENYFISYDKQGNMVDYNMPISMRASRNAGMGTYLKSNVITSGSAKNVYCGIHPDTSIWRRVSAYNFSNSSTVNVGANISISGQVYSGSISVSRSATNAFGFVIQVNDKRDSKLSVYCDFNYVQYQGYIMDSYTNKVISSFKYVTMTKTREAFIPIYA